MVVETINNWVKIYARGRETAESLSSTFQDDILVVFTDMRHTGVGKYLWDWWWGQLGCTEYKRLRDLSRRQIHPWNHLILETHLKEMARHPGHWWQLLIGSSCMREKTKQTKKRWPHLKINHEIWKGRSWETSPKPPAFKGPLGEE